MWLRKHQSTHSGKRIKICFVGWAEFIHVERWAGYFASLDYEVSVVSFSRPGHYPKGVRQYSVGFKRRRLELQALSLRYLLWKIKPDLVHVHWAGFAYLVARAWKGPIVVTPWGSDILRLHEQPRDAAEQVKRGLQAAHAITCNSEHLLVRLSSLGS